MFLINPIQTNTQKHNQYFEPFQDFTNGKMANCIYDGIRL